jgi:hypothetical protein
VLGTVEAGFPSPAEEELGDTLDLDEFLIRNKEATYMLKVTGDSMIEAGLMPGDLVSLVAVDFFVVVDGVVWLKPREQAITRAQTDIAICVRPFLKRIISLLGEKVFHTLHSSCRSQAKNTVLR